MKRISLRTLSLALIVLFLFMTIGMLYSLSAETHDAVMGSVRDKLTAVASVASTHIDGDSFSLLMAGDEGTDDFIRIRDQLRAVREATPGIRYIYTMRMEGDSIVFVVDADYGFEDDTAFIGDPYPQAEPEMYAGFTAPTADNEFTTDEWGTVLSGFSPIRDSSGNVVGIVGVDMDSSVVMNELDSLDLFFYGIGVIALAIVVFAIIVIEWRRAVAEQTIQVSERKYRALFEQAVDAILIFEAEGEDQGKIIDANSAAARMHGYTVDEMLTKNIGDLDTEDSRYLVKERFSKLLQKGSIRGEASHVRNDGSCFPIEINSTLLTHGDKKYVLAIDRDISERKSADDAIRRVSGKLSLLNAVTFNDIQNAVFTLNGYLTLSKSLATDEKQKKNLERAGESVKRITRSLDFAKNYQDLGTIPPRWQDVSPAFVMGISHLDFSRIGRSVHLNNLEIFADSLFERVFQSLADNVLRHGENADHVTIGYQQEGQDLILFFEDNGPGIPEDLKEKIFERGFGTQKGMELFLVREILGITGISIRETGRYGSGARFEMIIPKGGFRFPPGNSV